MNRNIVLLGIIAVTLLTTVGTVFAAKPAGNLAGAVTVPWHLSGAVMPYPWGQHDITCSDTASKLIVNQPNGATEVTITGAMNGLHPNTMYTVYLSNGYTLNVKRWSVIGTWKWLVLGTYEHDMIITTQNPDGTFSGYGGWPAGGHYQTTETITGQVIGNTITFTTTYLGPYNPGYSATVSGTIASDGTTMSGTSPWEWHTTFGAATYTLIGTGWPGLFTSTIPPFTFTTDAYGAGSWHVNLKDADLVAAGGSAPYTLSVWINEAGGTILVSDDFTVVND
jgi:hypothetical protein